MVNLLSFLLPLLVLLLGLTYMAIMRYFRHKEYMAMIEKGLSPHTSAADWHPFPLPPPASSPKRQLTGGIVTAAVGVAITLSLLTLGIGPWLIGGIIPTLVGLALIFTHFWVGES